MRATEPRIVFQVRVDQDLLDKFGEAAKYQDRPMSSLARELIRGEIARVEAIRKKKQRRA